MGLLHPLDLQGPKYYNFKGDHFKTVPAVRTNAR